MRARVLRAFRDNENKRFQKVDDTIDLTEERFKEINSSRYGNLVEEIEEKKKEDKKKEK